MDFLNFLESLKTEKDKPFLETVAIPAYKSLFEEILPANPDETGVLIDKTKSDLEDLAHLKQTQDELLKNEAELKQKAPDLVPDPNKNI